MVNIVPNFVTSPEYKKLAETLNSQVLQIETSENKMVLLDKPAEEVPAIYNFDFLKKSPTQFIELVQESFSVRNNTDVTKIFNNLERYLKIFSNPINTLPDNFLKANEIIFWQTLSFWEENVNTEQKISTFFNKALEQVKSVPFMMGQQPSQWGLQIRNIIEFQNVMNFLDLINDYLTIQDKKYSSTVVNDFLFKILQLLDPSFNANDLKPLLEKVNQFYIETWSSDSSTNLKDRTLDVLEGMVLNPVNFLVPELSTLYFSNYSDLTRVQKIQQTKLIRKLKIQREQALDEIFTTGCEIADLAATEQNPAKKNELEVKSVQYLSTFEELLKDLELNDSIKKEKNEGGNN